MIGRLGALKVTLEFIMAVFVVGLGNVIVILI